MRHARISLALVVAAVAALAGGCGPSTPKKRDQPKPKDDPWEVSIRAQLKPYLANEVVTGAMVGVIDGDREWTYGFGTIGNGGAEPTRTTLFELGAVTKVYTGALLAEAIERKEVELTTEVAALLPMGVTVPTRDQIPINLAHLVTHSAGLPPVPPGLASIPPARYAEESLFADLARTKLVFQPGTGFLYSNYGLGVLGVALARATKTGSWTEAVTTRVLGPLQLKDTVIAVPSGQSARHAIGHGDDGRVVPFSTFGALAPAAGLRSTIVDQLAFLRANLDAAAGKKGRIYDALRRSQEVLSSNRNEQITMGWFVDAQGRRYASGQTDGFHAFLQMDADRRHAVVVLASTATSLVDQLGDAIMDVMAKERPSRIRFPKPEQMMPYVGVYEVAATKVAFTVELDGKKLFVKTADGTRTRLMPVGGPRFYLERDQAFVEFHGVPATELVIAAPGQAIVAVRIDGGGGSGGSGSGSGSSGSGSGSGSGK
jgi:D-alanyl-D-alanine-carboxypeptidase/D-alanyl-D-alanine-endopeptidase